MTKSNSQAFQKSPIQSQIRRAAGGKSVAVLKELIDSSGWSASELDDLASNDGKCPLHMAAWNGKLENIEYLLDLGCNIDQIATGTHSYGKSAIFFAATRCRDDACMLLLKRGANVRIVNNKGQSVLSLAVTHLKPETIKAIQQAEIDQENVEWRNYHASHSDGANYGDLDPRFLGRSLVPDDVITDLVINPSSKASRKGNFARMNPSLARDVKKKETKKQPQRKEKPSPPPPTPDELEEQEEAWSEVDEALKHNDTDKLKRALLIIIHFGERQRRAWLPNAAERLQHAMKMNGDLDVEHLLSSIICSDDTDREVELIQKLFLATTDTQESTANKNKTDINAKNSVPCEEVYENAIDVSPQEWEVAFKSVKELSWPLLQNINRKSKYLSLPAAPIWVASREDLVSVKNYLHEMANDYGDEKFLVSFDTEWCTMHDGIALATIQLAWVVEGIPKAWVIDLKPNQIGDLYDTEYDELVKEVISWMFHDGRFVLLGFAIGHDLPKISTLVGTTISQGNCLDLQIVAAENMAINKAAYRKSNLPGLKACCSYYLSWAVAGSQHWELSKHAQCSNWESRPLTQDQLEYAGLDAGVLLVLLSSIYEKRESTER